VSIFHQRWSVTSAAGGGFAWLALLGISTAGRFRLEAQEELFLLAPLVVVPLGLELVRSSGSCGQRAWLLLTARLLQPLGAAGAVASFGLAAGPRAAGLAAGWLLVTGLAGSLGLAGILRSGFAPMERNCFNAALLYLPVGGGWLVLSRLGASPMGFKEPLVLLTAVHFHFSGFAAPRLVGAAGIQVGNLAFVRRRLFTATALGVIVGPALVAAGFVFAPVLKAFGAFLLTTSLTGLSVVVLGLLPSVRPEFAKRLLVISAASVVAGMILACVYSIGELASHEFIAIPQMAVFHGLVNGLGFALCGLIAWTFALPATRAR
jgi:YndJ-like protein